MGIYAFTRAWRFIICCRDHTLIIVLVLDLLDHRSGTGTRAGLSDLPLLAAYLQPKVAHRIISSIQSIYLRIGGSSLDLSNLEIPYTYTYNYIFQDGRLRYEALPLHKATMAQQRERSHRWNLYIRRLGMYAHLLTPPGSVDNTSRKLAHYTDFLLLVLHGLLLHG